MRIGSTLGAHPVVAASIALILVAGTTFILAYFEPQKLFIDDRVNEPLPSLDSATANVDPQATAKNTTGKPSQPTIQTLARGAFQSYEHSTSGQARVLRLADGSRFLRFESFETSNGPDVRVYLSAATAGGDGDAFDDHYSELGHLKGNIGNQNYVIPSGLHLGHFQSAVIWCKRFSVAFGAAPLQ
jgi:Electron transfer DM13